MCFQNDYLGRYEVWKSYKLVCYEYFIQVWFVFIVFDDVG